MLCAVTLQPQQQKKCTWIEVEPVRFSHPGVIRFLRNNKQESEVVGLALDLRHKCQDGKLRSAPSITSYLGKKSLCSKEEGRDDALRVTGSSPPNLSISDTWRNEGRNSVHMRVEDDPR